VSLLSGKYTLKDSYGRLLGLTFRLFLSEAGKRKENSVRRGLSGNAKPVILNSLRKESAF